MHLSGKIATLLKEVIRVKIYNSLYSVDFRLPSFLMKEVVCEIYESDPIIERRYFLTSELDLEAYPEYQIEDNKTSPTISILEFASVVFLKEIRIPDYKYFKTREYMLGNIENKSDISSFRKTAETITEDNSRRKSGAFRKNKKNRLMFDIGGLVMGFVGYDKGGFEYENDITKYFNGTSALTPDMFIPYNFHHPGVIPTHLPEGNYQIPINGVVFLGEEFGKILNLEISRIEYVNETKIIHWNVPDTKIGDCSDINSKGKEVISVEFFSASGEIQCNTESVIQSYHTEITHQVYHKQKQVEDYHRITEGELIDQKILDEKQKIRRPD